MSPAAIKLKLSSQEKGIHPVISISNIHPYTPDEIMERPSPSKPGPLIIDGHEEFEVENVLDSRFRYRWLWYLVKFAGWPNSDNMWLPHLELEHAPNIIQNFHALHPKAPNHLTTVSPSTSRRSGLRGR